MPDEHPTLREAGRIVNVFAGREDHDLLTVSVSVQFETGGEQAFGNLAFETEAFMRDFRLDLHATFGVQEDYELIGLPCKALRCFVGYNEMIEGLEASSGKRFILTAWRQKHHMIVPSPLEARTQRIEGQIAALERQIRIERDRLEQLASRYRPILEIS